MPLERLRPHASAGARGLIGAGFGITPDHKDYPLLQKRFLAFYESQLCGDTRLFPGIAELLAALDRLGIPWGIVTNKVGRFTRPVVAGLGLTERAACIVSGDGAARPKPDAAPLLLACELARVDPARSLYVGDDERDVQAGHAAGMGTVVAGWGYLGGAPVETWGGDYLINHPSDLLGLLGAKSPSLSG